MHLTINGEPCEVDAATLLELVGPVPIGHALAVNGEVVPRTALGHRMLVEGDVIELVTAVAGG